MAKVIKLSKTVYCKIIKEISDVIVGFDEGERMLIVSFCPAASQSHNTC